MVSRTQLPWMAPLVTGLVSQEFFFVLIKLIEALEICWILGDQGSFLEEIQLITQVLLLRKVLDIFHEVVIRDTREWVAHSV